MARLEPRPERMPETSDIRLGQRLIQRQWCTLARVKEALDLQKKLKARSRYRPIGRILVELGYLSEEQLMEALAGLGALAVTCPACGWGGRVETVAPGQRVACARCHEPVMVSDEPVARRRPAAGETQAPAPASEAAPDAEVPTLAVRLEELDSARSGPAAGSPSPVPSGSAGAEGSPAGPDPFVGRVLGGCKLTEMIARGGMGVVYKACQLNLNRTVAVKVLAEDLARDQDFVRRFLEEARAAAQLSHHNIIHINDVGECDGVFYFTMEHVEGENLKSVLRRKKALSVDRSLVISLQVCNALRHAHERGIVHRDIKPENIMITGDGIVKLADLGLAKRMDAANDGLTKAGSIFGTPYYMAPEQARNFSSVDYRSDIYSLGVTLYRMVGGKVPFDGRSPIEIMVKAFDGTKAPLSSLRKDMPEGLEALVDRMMARRPEDRYQHLDEVIQDLKKALGALSSRHRSDKILTLG